MTIKSKVTALLVVAGVITLIVGATVYLAVRATDEGLREISLYYDLTNKVLALNTLSESYLREPQTRTKVQWEATYRSLGALIEAIRAVHPDAGDSVRREYEKVGAAFSLLRGDGSPAATEALTAAVRQRTIDRLFVALRVMADKGSLLLDETKEGIARRQARATLMTVLLVVGLVLTSSTVMLVVLRRLSRSILSLGEGARRIAAGQLDHRIATSHNDELAGLAREFNRMATERQRTEEALREKAELLRLSHDAILIWRPVAGTESWSRGAETLYGYTEAEAIGRVPRELLQTRCPVSWEQIETALRTEGGWQGELRQRTKDGREVVVTARLQLVRGGSERVLESNQDLTERTRAEGALRASEARLADIIRQAPAFMCVLRGPDHVFELANEEYFRLVGRRDLVGQPLEKALPELGSQGYGELLDRVYATGEPFEGREMRVLLERQPGAAPEEAWVDFVYLPLRDADHRVSGIFVHGVDLTAEVRARHRIEESEARLRTMADAMPQLAWIAQPDGFIFWYNQRWYDYTGTTPEQMEGWGWERVHDPTVLPAVLERWKGSISTGQPFDMVFPLRGADGCFHPFLTRVFPLKDDQGQVVQWFGTNTDITERIEAEEGLRRALADKETLIQEVHHRTKNNLQMICSLLELQAETIVSPEGKEALELSTGRIYAIATLYEQLYRTMSSGQVLLSDYLAGLAESFKTSHGTSAINFRLPARNGIALDMDRAIPCGLILNELFTNAVKHAFPAGTAGEIGVDVQQVGDRIQLRVWDTGRGLPEGLDIEHSTSLGLRLVRILAQRLRADVKIDSFEGAAFTLTFPLDADPPVGPTDDDA
jgi:PAS domain S-box-containing protein